MPTETQISRSTDVILIRLIYTGICFHYLCIEYVEPDQNALARTMCARGAWSPAEGLGFSCRTHTRCRCRGFLQSERGLATPVYLIDCRTSVNSAVATHASATHGGGRVWNHCSGADICLCARRRMERIHRRYFSADLAIRAAALGIWSTGVYRPGCHCSILRDRLLARD